MAAKPQALDTEKKHTIPPWHAMTGDESLSSLGVDDSGLSTDEVNRRLEEFGPNQLADKEKAGPLKRFLRQFQNMLIYILVVAAVFTALLGEWIDTAVIAAVVFINAIIGFIQEGKAEKAMESIRGMLSPVATALRDGTERELPAAELVPGDIVIIGSGDRVPADLRILYARNARADESALTGESEPVAKRVDPVQEDAPLGDRKSMAFSGTVLTSGQLRGVVTATGEQAQIGRISEMVSEVEEIATPLVRKMDRFGRGLSVFIVLLSFVIFAIGYLLRGFGFTEMVMAVVSLAVAAIPQGLPAIMTVTLALGVQRMARRNAIVRRLPAVETLGSVTVICSDKTGTLTRNEMTVAKIAAADRTYSVSGTGYQPEGGFKLDEDGGAEISLEAHPWITELARTGLLANEARLRKDNGNWVIDGMPTEGSLVVLGRKAGMTRTDEQEKRPRLDVIPFESERRFMATLNRDPDGGNILYVKGAPERILEMCSRQRTDRGDGPVDKQAWLERQEKLAGTGHRVLALATRRMDGTGSIEEDQVEDLTLLGLVGIIDPPREEAIDAIKKSREAGIRVKMITGDHALTARSIGAAMGIGDGEHAVTGRDLEKMDREEMVRQVNQCDIFARSSPEHKLRMIEALQSKGQVVAMTGDGVNDAPALKRADVGVSMGIKGSEAAKEASEMVLADDNFATIERAVEEGRTIYDNLVKVILFVLPTNGAEALMIISAVIILFEVMPITPLQILWVNMVTAVTLAVSLAFEPPQGWIMRRPPRPPDEPIISAYLLWRILFVAVLIATASIVLFNYRRAGGASLPAARTVAVNTLVAGQLFYLFNSRYIERSSLRLERLLGNKTALISVFVLVALQLAFTYLGPMQQLFQTASISLLEWGWILAAGFGVFLIVEVEKAAMRGLRSLAPRPGEAEEEKPEAPLRLEAVPSRQPAPFVSHQTLLRQETARAAAELGRSGCGLFLSGLIAGSGAGLSMLLLGVLQSLFGGEPGSLGQAALTASAYAFGFSLILMARTDLFAEYGTTLTLMPVLSGQSAAAGLVRHGAAIYIANLLGGAALVFLLWAIGPELAGIDPELFGQTAAERIRPGGGVIFGGAVLTGWLMGLLAWLGVTTRDDISRVFFIFMVAGFIGLARLPHAIFGTMELLLGVAGSDVIGRGRLAYFLLWATFGNIAGGLLFALLLRFGDLRHERVAP